MTETERKFEETAIGVEASILRALARKYEWDDAATAFYVLAYGDSLRRMAEAWIRRVTQ